MGTLIMVISVLLCGVFFVVQQSGVERIELAHISQYMDKTNLNTSLGIRLQLWKSVLASFWRSHCLLG